MRAAAEPLPDDPDNRRDNEIQVTRIPDGPNVGNFSCEMMEKECLMLNTTGSIATRSSRF